MIKIQKLLLKSLVLLFLLVNTGCYIHVDDHDHHHIDPRFPFLGYYDAEESFIDPVTGAQEIYLYEIEVREAASSEIEILITGLQNNGIYGTGCGLIGEVNGTHINIPLNVCHYNSNVTYNITGHGDLLDDGHHLILDLDIMRCEGNDCGREPAVHIHAHRK